MRKAIFIMSLFFSLMLLLIIVTAVSQSVFASTAPTTVVLSCPPRDASGDRIDRGFYITPFPGLKLGHVTMYYWTPTAGTYVISLTARENAYDGVVFASDVITVTLQARTTTPATFNMGQRLVSPDITLAFIQEKLSGPGDLYYDTGGHGFIGNPDAKICPGVFQTEGTTPPLDTLRRRGVAIEITQEAWKHTMPLVLK